jgi:hypothetical protein
LSEIIYKLQPNRCAALRGFDHLGASAALHSASETGFTASGAFRDPSDFAVVVIWDADNFYEHPRLKYLPDFNFSGIGLSFKLQYENLMPIDCEKYATIDWPYLDVTDGAGNPHRVRLSNHAVQAGGVNAPATAAFTLSAGELEPGDRVTLWYQNFGFDYVVPGKVRTEFEFYASGVGTVHSLTVAGRTYSYTEEAGDSSAAVAEHLRARAAGEEGGYAADPDALASAGSAAHKVSLAAKLDTGASFAVSGSGGAPDTLWHVKLSTVLQSLRDQVNSAGYVSYSAPFALHAEIDGATLRLETVKSGYDANFLRMYAAWKNDRLRATEETVAFTGGRSDAIWQISLNFAALGVTSIRQMWLTLAPRLTDGAAMETAEWRAVFSDWTVTGADSVRRLKVAAPGSVRVASGDERCAFNGVWVQEAGFFDGNFARASATANDSVQIRYHCAQPHDLWLGTSLYPDRGRVSVEIDGAPHPAFDASLAQDPGLGPVNTRRRLASGLAAGDHVVRLRLLDAKPFYFDFIEAAVPGDVPDALAARSNLTAALDYSTDHAYKLPPARILWNLDRLGLTGPLNQYLGVFWWNQRQRAGAVVPSVQIEFGGAFAAGDIVTVAIGGAAIYKTVLGGETPAVIARHFAYIVNSRFVGVWAQAGGAALTLHARSPEPVYSYSLTAGVQQAPGSTGTAAVTGALSGGDPGVWRIDPVPAQVLNRGARDWHADFYAQCAARNREATTAISMELVNPPESWAARFPDGAPVTTAVGFASLHSTHCAFNTPVRTYQGRVLRALADLQAAAGLTPSLQLGEFTWWYFSNHHPTQRPNGGMAYYEAETAAAAQAALGRPLHLFQAPTSDPGVNAHADALFLRNRLRDHAAALIAEVRAARPAARFEVLFPYDVNHPEPAGVHGVGGRLNRFVNLPVEWERKETAGFDRFKIEALDFSAWSRNLDLARLCLRLPLELGWPAADSRALLAVFRGSYPWQREVEFAEELGYGQIVLWAFDHVCLFGLGVEERSKGRASRQGG